MITPPKHHKANINPEASSKYNLNGIEFQAKMLPGKSIANKCPSKIKIIPLWKEIDPQKSDFLSSNCDDKLEIVKGRKIALYNVTTINIVNAI
jgi:hypothetical protein